MKCQVIDLDSASLLNKSHSDASLQHVYAVAASSESSWPKVWDETLDNLSRVLLEPQVP